MTESLLKKNEEYGSITPEESEEDNVEHILELDKVYQKIGRGLVQYLYWILTGLLTISVQLQVCIISVILPSLRCQWHLSPAFESGISNAVFIFYAIFTIAFGKISDKIGRKLVLQWSTSILILASVASAVAPEKWTFLVARSVTGACIGVTMNCIVCYATEFSESKDHLIGMTVFNMGCAISPPLVYFLAWLMQMSGDLGWRWLTVAISSPTIPAFIMLFSMPGSPRFLLVSGQQDEAIKATRFMAKLNKTHLPLYFTLEPLRNEKLGSYSIIFGPEHRRSVLALSGQRFSILFIVYAFILYQPLMYTNGCTSGTAENSIRPCSFTDMELLELTLSTLPFLLAQILACLTSPVLWRLVALRVGSFLMMGVTVALFFCINITVIFWVAAAINFLGGFNNAYLWVILPETFPTNIRATAIGFTNCCALIGGVLGTISVSVLYYIYAEIVAALILTAAIFGFVMSLIYDKETKDLALKDT